MCVCGYGCGCDCGCGYGCGCCRQCHRCLTHRNFCEHDVQQKDSHLLIQRKNLLEDIESRPKEDSHTVAKKAADTAQSVTAGVLLSLTNATTDIMAKTPNKRNAAVAVDAGYQQAAIDLVNRFAGDNSIMTPVRDALGTPSSIILNKNKELQDLQDTKSCGEKWKHNNRLKDHRIDNKEADANSDDDDDCKLLATTNLMVTPARDRATVNQEYCQSVGFQTRHKTPDNVLRTPEPTKARVEKPDNAAYSNVTGLCGDSPVIRVMEQVGLANEQKNGAQFLPSKEEIATVKQHMLIYSIKCALNMEEVIDLDDNNGGKDTSKSKDPNGAKRFQILTGEMSPPNQSMVDTFIGTMISCCRKKGLEIDAAKFCSLFDAFSSL